MLQRVDLLIVRCLLSMFHKVSMGSMVSKSLNHKPSILILWRDILVSLRPMGPQATWRNFLPANVYMWLEKMVMMAVLTVFAISSLFSGSVRFFSGSISFHLLSCCLSCLQLLLLLWRLFGWVQVLPPQLSRGGSRLPPSPVNPCLEETL